MTAGRWQRDTDSEIANVGREIFWVIVHMMEGDIYDRPEEIRDVFEAMLADAALIHGWWQDSEGHWYRPVLTSLEAAE